MCRFFDIVRISDAKDTRVARKTHSLGLSAILKSANVPVSHIDIKNNNRSYVVWTESERVYDARMMEKKGKGCAIKNNYACANSVLRCSFRLGERARQLL